MLISRWKLMAGAVGLSIGGIAAFGGQIPLPGSAKAEDVPMVNLPAPAKPPANENTLPSLPPVPTTVVPPSTPSVPAAKPTTPAELPALPLPDSKTKTEPPVPTTPPVKAPMDIPVLPASGTTASPVELPPTAPTTAPASPPPAPFAPPTLPSTPPTKPVAITPVEPALPTVEAVPVSTKPATVTANNAPAPVPTKFRIVLRVGSGEPTFEVRHEDDLVMKVVCDKVDIKSPEKGQGPSNVVATGKVRFVGFGAEGTCDSLSFLAGTGEVSLAGNVNVKVRDKIGRVESELHADKMQYKLDQTALTGVLKP